MYQIFNGLTADFHDLCFPALCPVCRKALVHGEHTICSFCLKKMHIYRENNLQMPLEYKYLEPLSRVNAFLVFTRYSVTQEVLHHMKYSYGRSLAKKLGRVYGIRLNAVNNLPVADMIVPIPQHWRRHWSRGYNQAGDFAYGLSIVLGIPLRNDIINVVVHSSSQTNRSRIERWKAVKSRFRIKKGVSIKGLSILLVDDVITTGATTEACAVVLLRNGAKKVGVLSLAVAR